MFRRPQHLLANSDGNRQMGGSTGGRKSGEPTSATRYPMGLEDDIAREISSDLAMLLADVFAVFVKTKNFHWHLSGPHFRTNYLLLKEQSQQIFEMTDALADRARRIGGTTLRSISHIARLQRILDNDSQYESAATMLSELQSDNQQLLESMRLTRSFCDESGDVATANLLEHFIDETEGRIWFLFEASQT